MSYLQRITLIGCLSSLVAGTADSAQAEEQRVSFSRDIMPMLTKLSCNTTECHDALHGKGGLKLSPLGSDPLHDFNALARADGGRRVSAIDPDHSLLLRRLSGPGSTVKLKPGSEPWRRFHVWTAADTPGPDVSDPHVVELTATPARVVLRKGESQTVQIRARWSDGVVRDVTRWCRFEPEDGHDEYATISAAGKITGNEPGRTVIRIRFLKNVASVDVLIGFDTRREDWDWAPNNVIDEIVARTWREVGMAPAEPAADHRFLRRVWLQILGRSPSEQDARDFLTSTHSMKRARLIDELLARREFTDHWARVWTIWLLEDRRVGWESVSRGHDKPDHVRLQHWLRTKFEGRDAIPSIIRGVLTATGSTPENGAAVFYAGQQRPDHMARSFGQVFLGMSFRCARCHDHPHGPWGTDDFYGIAAAFRNVSVRDEKDRPVTVEITPVTSFQNPRTGATVSPHVFGVPLPDNDRDPRHALADWILGEGRMRLARNIVHRYWTHFFGRPLMHWVDDLTPSSPERHPGLLDALARELIDSDFDTQRLIRLICEARVYQLDSDRPKVNADDWFNSRFSLVRLPDHILKRSIRTAAGLSPDPDNDSDRQIPIRRDDALAESDIECSRGSYRSPSHYGLYLINSREVEEAIRDPNGIVARLKASDASIEDVTRRLFVRILHRPPTEAEWAELRDYLRKEDRTVVTEDVFWMLVNTKEFIFLY